MRVRSWPRTCSSSRRQPSPPGARATRGRSFQSRRSALVVRRRLQVLAKEVAPEVAVEVAPHRVNVVAVVLRVVVLDEERRSLHAVVVLLPALGLAGPGERDLLGAGFLQARHAIGG